MSIALTMDMLFALQKVDDDLASIEADREKHRKAVETESEKLSKALAWAAAARAEMKSRRIREAGAEQKIAVLREKAVKLEQKIYSVKNNKELAAIEAEQARLTADISAQEDQMLEILEGLEDLGGKLAFAEAETAKMRERLEDRKTSSVEFESEAMKRREFLEGVREKLCTCLDASALRAYDEGRRRHSGTAIMAMIDETCPKCSFGISKSLMASLVTSDSAEACRECGMLLFWPHPIEKRNCGECSRTVDPEELSEVFSRGEPFTCDRCGKIYDPAGFGAEETSLDV